MDLHEQLQSQCRYVVPAIVTSGTVLLPVTSAYADTIEDVIHTVSSSTTLTFGTGAAVGAVVAGLLALLLHLNSRRRYLNKIKSAQHQEQQAKDELWYVKERLELLKKTVRTQEQELETLKAHPETPTDADEHHVDVEDPVEAHVDAEANVVEPIIIDEPEVYDTSDLDEVLLDEAIVEPVIEPVVDPADFLDVEDLDEAVVEPLEPSVTNGFGDVLIQSMESVDTDDLDEAIVEPMGPVDMGDLDEAVVEPVETAPKAAHMAYGTDDVITIQRGAVVDYPPVTGGFGDTGFRTALSAEDLQPNYDLDDIADVMNVVSDDMPLYRNVRVVLEERLTPDAFTEVSAARRAGLRSDIPAFLGQRRARQYDPIVRASLIDQRVPRFDESLFPDSVTHVHEELDVFETAMRAMEDTLQHTAVLGIEEEEDILYLSPEERPEIVDAAAYVDYLVQDELEKTLSGEPLPPSRSHLSLFEDTGDINASKQYVKYAPRHMRVVSKDA